MAYFSLGGAQHAEAVKATIGDIGKHHGASPQQVQGTLAHKTPSRTANSHKTPHPRCGGTSLI